MVTIIPGILTDDEETLAQLLGKAEGVVGRVQIDVVDGEFAHSKTVDPKVFREVFTDLRLDFHLMVEKPIGWVTKCVDAGADRVFGHVERMDSQIKFVEKVLDSGVSVGLALDLKTDISRIDSAILSDLDGVLLMSVIAGADGQKFERRTLKKVRELVVVRQKEQLKFKICVDGGVLPSLVKDLEKAGVDEVVVGKRIFEGRGIHKNLSKYNDNMYYHNNL